MGQTTPRCYPGGSCLSLHKGTWSLINGTSFCFQKFKDFNPHSLSVHEVLSGSLHRGRREEEPIVFPPSFHLSFQTFLLEDTNQGSQESSCHRKVGF